MGILDEIETEQILTHARAGIATSRKRLKTIAGLSAAGLAGTALGVYDAYFIAQQQNAGSAALICFLSYPATVAFIEQANLGNFSFHPSLQFINGVFEWLRYSAKIVDEGQDRNWLGLAIRLTLAWLTLGVGWTITGGLLAWGLSEYVSKTGAFWVVAASAVFVSGGNLLHALNVLRLTKHHEAS